MAGGNLLMGLARQHILVVKHQGCVGLTRVLKTFQLKGLWLAWLTRVSTGIGVISVIIGNWNGRVTGPGRS